MRRVMTAAMAIFLAGSVGPGRDVSASPRHVSPNSPILVSASGTCPAAVLTRFRQASGGARITTTVVTSTAMVICEYHATRARPGACAALRLSVDTGASAYRDFQRWVVETGQTAAQSSKGAAGHFPITVSGLAIEADWVPATRLLGAATLQSWVSVALQCQVADRPGLALATSVAGAAIG